MTPARYAPHGNPARRYDVDWLRVLGMTAVFLVHTNRLDAPLWLEYPIIAVGSFAVIIMLYELLIKRLAPLRFLFGMKLARRVQGAPAPQPLPNP
jgi:hypothetical protein